jgi:hypothetical protein
MQPLQKFFGLSVTIDTFCSLFGKEVIVVYTLQVQSG